LQTFCPMTLEEAVEEVLKGPDEIICKACQGKRTSFKGGNEVGNVPTSGLHGQMKKYPCFKCDGMGLAQVVSMRYIEARQMLGLPPWRPR
jgi:hypothetical protein